MLASCPIGRALTRCKPCRASRRVSLMRILYCVKVQNCSLVSHSLGRISLLEASVPAFDRVIFVSVPMYGSVPGHMPCGMEDQPIVLWSCGRVLRTGASPTGPITSSLDRQHHPATALSLTPSVAELARKHDTTGKAT